MAAADDDLYEFNAPNYFDFTGNDDTEVDESYFDCPRSAKMKDEGVVLKELQPRVPSSHGVPMETPKRAPHTSPSDAQEKIKIQSDDKDCPRSAEMKDEGVVLKELQPRVPSSHGVPMETPKRAPHTSPSDAQEKIKIESDDKDCPRSAEMKDEGVVLKELQPRVPSSHGVPMETPKRAPHTSPSDAQEKIKIQSDDKDCPRSAKMKDEGVVLKELQPRVPSSHGVPMETLKRAPHTSPSDAQEKIKIESDDKDCQRSGEVKEAISIKEVKQAPSSHAVPMETPNRPLTFPPSDVKEEMETEDKENAGSNSVRSVRTAKLRRSLKGISPNVCVRQSPRLAAIAKALRRKNAARQSFDSTLRNSSCSPHDSQKSKVHKLKILNKPSIPKIMGMKGLSSCDKKDLEAIATFKKKIANNKKKTDNSAATESSKSIRPGRTMPQEFHFATDNRLRTQKKDTDLVKDNETAAHSLSKPTKLGPTKPQEFHFATDSRIKNQAPVEENETVEFTRSLRSNTSSVNKEAPKGPTIPQPFNLTESRKGKTEEINKFVSVAELNLKFHTKTPQRFRSKRAGSIDDLNLEGKKAKSNSGVTIPHTPNLITRERSRHMNYLTHEEMEQKAFEEAQKHAFKANPVNKKVFEAPAYGYQVEKKIVTAPEPFNITDSKRDQRPLGLKFQEICERLGGSASSVASLPHGGIPSKWDKTNTKVQPFSFDLRDKTKLQRKQEMIQKVLEEEKKLAEFYAHPMPSFESGVRGVPHKKPPTPTKVVPFNLKVEERGNSKQEQIQRTLEEQARQEKELRKFLARSDAVLHKQPFVPEKSKKPLTDISGFTLNTEVRASERMEYELHRKRMEDEILAAKREQEKRQEEEEAEEIARLRRNIIHKANPIRKYKPLLEHAPQPPTVPISPNFATESRLRSRTRADSTVNISSTTFTSE